MHKLAARRDALTTHAVFLVEEDEVERRNADRVHVVPPDVLATQLRRYGPPYAAEAHRTRYIDADGVVADVDDAAHGVELP